VKEKRDFYAKTEKKILIFLKINVFYPTEITKK